MPAAAAGIGIYTNWKIPEINSNLCLMKISKHDDPAVYDISDTTFKIVSDLNKTKIVILGSSTAYGTGANPSDSAWVNLYRNNVFQKNTNVQVINLAFGGYSTYDIMPAGFAPPAGRPSPKAGKNITTALAYEPKAVIINLPSNDVNLGFSINEQLANYWTIMDLADASEIPVWISTTQPRNFSDAQRLLQIEMRDSTIFGFGDAVLDFWTGLANDDGTINIAFNSGDGIHLNNAGHNLLYHRVLSAGIYEKTILPTEVNDEYIFTPTSFELLQNFPNPFNSQTNINFSLSEASHINLIIYNSLGQKVATPTDAYLVKGIYQITWDASNCASGLYIAILSSPTEFKSQKMMFLK
ncbi:MAG: T9SS type A sorting domain-containing protein [Bacteroidetes bacterium]|nr:T9SS type A sorting domain-containing protein [Bacteroidota bacterium]